MKLSICIPTYNRSAHLANCLASIIFNKQENADIEFQVCVSNNCSTDSTEQVVRDAQESIDIRYNKNQTNIGIPRNFLKVIDMADGEFIWLIGDDDLLMPTAIEELHKLFSEYTDVDFFYINSFHLTTKYVFSYPQPFDIKKLPYNMKPFSNWPKSGEMKFLDLINPKISFDFLAGMYLSVFRKKDWEENVAVLNANAITDVQIFSHFDNTIPHVKIFAKAFANSKAFFNSKPLSVCLTGAREWAPMYPLVHSVRLVEALNEYKKNGLTVWQYMRCKNYALNNFIPDLVSMFINKERTGFVYISPFRLILNNCLYPNFYISVINYFIRKIKLQCKKLFLNKGNKQHEKFT
jgi:glycosyltransferase involved in cell wall biosynthesis